MSYKYDMHFINVTLPSLAGAKTSRGLTLIELLLIIGIIATIIAWILPIYSNFVIRSKISKSFDFASEAREEVNNQCLGLVSKPARSITAVKYNFDSGSSNGDYIERIEVSGFCSEPVITVFTENTGQKPEPILIMTGSLPTDAQQMKWKCFSNNTPKGLLPSSCLR